MLGTYDISIQDLEEHEPGFELYHQDVFEHLSIQDWNVYDEFLVLAGRAYIEPIQDLLD